MNVLFLTNNRTLGGTIRILQSWLLLAPSHGIRGCVVVPTGSDFCQWLRANDIAHIESDMSWPNRRKPWQALWDASRVALWARRQKIEILHCNEHDVYPFGQVVRRILKLPMVCHVRYRVDREFATWAFGGRRCPDVLLWTSRQQKDDSAASIEGVVPEERQHVIPLGLDLNRFGTRTAERDVMRGAWDFRPDDIVVGQCCALRSRKRIEEFVDLVSELAAEDERVVGVLAGDAPPGDEPYREKVLRHIESKGLGRRFRWLGNLNDVEPFYQAIDIFVSTSEYETFGNSVCEAMACARPVTGYAGGSIQEVVGDAGGIVETGDYQSLVGSTRHFVRDEKARQCAGLRGQERVARQFNPAATIQRVKQIYAALDRGTQR
jgi:glycosyltransferase involved in cell wall biosynthesis